MNVLDSLEGTLNNPGEVRDLTLSIHNGGDSFMLALVTESLNGLNPAAPQILDSQGDAVAPVFAADDHAGTTDGFALVNLGVGDFTVRIIGEGDTTGSFRINVTLPGDRDQDGVIGDDELLLATAAMVQTLGSANFNTELFYRERGIDLSTDLYDAGLDANRDGKIDHFDLQQIEANHGAPQVELDLIGDSEPPLITVSVTPDTGRDTGDGVTNDSNAVISGSVTDESDISSFSARIDGGAIVDLLSLLGQDFSSFGDFQLSRSALETIAGGTVLNNGPHNLQLTASDFFGNENDLFATTFQFDTQAPNAADESLTTDEETSIAGDLLENASDAGGSGQLRFLGITDTAIGDLVTDMDGSFTYDPSGASVLQSLAVGQNETETFTYTIDDLAGNVATGILMISISGVNDAPTAIGDLASTDEDTTTSGNLLTNDTDVDSGETAQLVVDAAASDTSTEAGAMVTITANGDFTYNPTASSQIQALVEGESLSDTFSYVIRDPQGATSSALVTVTVSGVNDSPSANDLSASTDEDSPLVVEAPGVLGNDTDADDGQTATLSVTGFQASSARGAAVTVNADGSYSYDPTGSTELQALKLAESLTDTFTYTISDVAELTATATVTVSVSGLTDVPIAANDVGSTDEDTVLTSAASVLSNDTDADAGETAQLLVDVANSDSTSQFGAAITLSADGNFTYDPTGSTQLQSLVQSGSLVDTFSYTVVDPTGASATATVSITVNGINDPPTVGGVDASTDEDTVFQLTAPGLLASANDIDNGEAATLTITDVDSTGVSGNISFESDGSFRYDPTGSAALQALKPGESVVETFSFTVGDAQGATATASMTLTVSGLNDSPMAAPDNFGTDEDTALSIAAPGVLTNDTDADFGETDQLIVSASDSTSAQGASVTVNSDGSFTYDPTGSSTIQSLLQDATTTDTFTYTITDSSSETASTTVSITVTGVNDAPTAVDDSPTVTAVTTTEIDVLVNDLDPDLAGGDSLRVVAVDTTGTTGLVTFDDSGVTFDPDGQYDNLSGNQTASTSFTYTIEDSEGLSSTAMVNVTVAANQPPVAQPDFFNASATATLSGNVLVDNGNGPDSDPEQTTLTVSAEMKGTLLGADVQLNGDGSFTYDPTNATGVQNLGPGEDGQDTFTYTISDEGGATAMGTVTVNVTGVDDPPVARDDTFAVNANLVLSGNLLADNGSGSDFDPDGDSLVLSAATLTTGQGAEVSVLEDGSFTYDPRSSSTVRALPNGQTLADTFTYTLSDGNNLATGTAGVTVTGVNDAPVAVGTEFVLTVSDTDVPRTAGVDSFTQSFDLNSFFTDVDGDSISYQISSQSPNASLFSDVVANNDQLEVTLIEYRSNQDRSDASVTIQASDPSGASTMAEFTLVGSPNKTIDVQLVVLAEPSSELLASGTETLPTSTTQAIVGQTLIAEIWLQDDLVSSVTGGPITNGITGGSFNLAFDSALLQAATGGLHHEGPFSSQQFATGTIDNVGGVISNFGGGTINPDFGIEPQFVRLGFVEFEVIAAGQESFTITPAAQVARQSDPADASIIGNIHNSQLNIVAPSPITLVNASTFNIVSASSELRVSSGSVDGGGALLFQEAGVSDRATIQGTIQIVVDDFTNPTSLQLVGANIDLQSSGDWAPGVNGASGTAAADFGLIENVEVAPGTILPRNIAIREVLARLTSEPITVSGGNFAAASISSVLTGGAIDTRLFTSGDSTSLQGTIVVDNGSANGTFSTQPTVATVTIPISRTLSMTIDGTTVSLELAGQIVAQLLLPESEGFAAEHDARSRMDVNGDGSISAVDALIGINTILGEGESIFAARADINGDGRVSPIDPLMIINYLNAMPEAFAEGEAGPRRAQSLHDGLALEIPVAPISLDIDTDALFAERNSRLRIPVLTGFSARQPFVPAARQTTSAESTSRRATDPHEVAELLDDVQNTSAIDSVFEKWD